MMKGLRNMVVAPHSLPIVILLLILYAAICKKDIQDLHKSSVPVIIPTVELIVE